MVLIDSSSISHGEKLQNHLTSSSSSLYIHPTCSLLLLHIVNASNLESNWYDIYKKKELLLLASPKSPERLMICFWQTKQYYYCYYNVYSQFLHSRSTKSSFVISRERQRQSHQHSTKPKKKPFFSFFLFLFLSLLSANTHTQVFSCTIQNSIFPSNIPY